jgi:putative hydrolase of HD superfamily
MRTKASNPAEILEGKEASPLVRALFAAGHLKNLFRQGWLRRGVPEERCETVAEHSFGTALLAFLLADAVHPGMDTARVLGMALVHDLGEIGAGDLTPADDIEPGEKLARERRSVEGVLAGLPNGPELITLWDEFAEGRTPEARLVRHADRLEMALQAAVYGLQGLGDPAEFLATARRDIDDPGLREVVAEIEGLS